MKLVMNMRFAAYCVSAAALIAFGGSGVEAAFLTKNLQICDQGSFFVGGVPKITKFANSVTPAANYAQITVGQMYVQFQVPVAAKKWPLIMVHGSTHSGACVESTPQGTEGWASYTVRNKLATYVVDQPGRGRSGNDNSRLQEAEATHLGLPGANATFPRLQPRLGQPSAGSAITGPTRIGSATLFSQARPRPARTSSHASFSHMGGGPTTHRLPACTPIPPGMVQPLPSMPRRSSSIPQI